MDLEDFHNDIIGKAQRGLKLSDDELCQKANIDDQSLKQAKSGNFNEEALKKIAFALKLDPEALVISAKKSWKPHNVQLAVLKQFASKYNAEGGLVNSYLIWDSETKEGILADTGMDATEMLETIDKLKIKPSILLLTHSHNDHIAELEKIRKAFPDLKIVISKKEPISGAEGIEAGNQFRIGKLTITARDTSGHSPGGLTYIIEGEGLDRQIAVVGDALFAGSMGGAASAYEEALDHNRKEILSLPEDTIICPGHGPMTTVGEEKEHNPFFPEFKN